MGARDTYTSVVSRVWRCSRSPSDISSAPAVQLGQPSSHSGSNMKWLTISWRRPSNRSSSDAGPSGPCEHVVLLDADHGQLAPLGAERVAALGHGLLLAEQVDAGCAPLLG